MRYSRQKGTTTVIMGIPPGAEIPPDYEEITKDVFDGVLASLPPPTQAESRAAKIARLQAWVDANPLDRGALKKIISEVL